MTEYHDFFINSEIEETAEWSREAADLESVIIEASDWEELKEEIKSERTEADILAFKGGDEELNRKAVEQSEIDVILHPEKNRKNSGINQVIAKKASKNNVAIGYDFAHLYNSNKREKIMSQWRQSLKILEKYNAPYLITTSASSRKDIRAPRDLSAVIEVLGGYGLKAVKKTPTNLLKTVKDREKSLRPGIEEIEE